MRPIKNILFCIGLHFALIFDAYGQELTQSGKLEIEADPIAYIFSGYSIHLGYQKSHLKYNIGAFGIRQPDFFVSQESFNIRTNGFGIKADYLIKRRRGLFVGVQVDFITDKVSLKDATVSEKQRYINMGLRTGYRFMFGKETSNFKGLYIVPWVAFNFKSNSSSIILENSTYEPKSFSVFPTVHLGYSF